MCCQKERHYYDGLSTKQHCRGKISIFIEISNRIDSFFNIKSDIKFPIGVRHLKNSEGIPVPAKDYKKDNNLI